MNQNKWARYKITYESPSPDGKCVYTTVVPVDVVVDKMVVSDVPPTALTVVNVSVVEVGTVVGVESSLPVVGREVGANPICTLQ